MSEMMDRIQAIIDRWATNGSERSSDLARDILEEMMEPARHMLDAGIVAAEDALDHDWDSGCDGESYNSYTTLRSDAPATIWKAMIEAALKVDESAARTNSDFKTVLKTASEPEEKPQ